MIFDDIKSRFWILKMLYIFNFFNVLRIYKLIRKRWIEKEISEVYRVSVGRWNGYIFTKRCFMWLFILEFEVTRFYVGDRLLVYVCSFGVRVIGGL